jgi:poly(3-hydroxybutyrate) depolymerase
VDKVKLVHDLNYAYALEAVRRGYVVMAPDWCPFGERRPPDLWSRVGRDPCNVTNMGWQYFGRPLLTQNIWDAMRAVDVLMGHANVDRRRVGVIGLSYGGTMATHLLVNDRRIRAGVVSGYISTLRGDALNMRGKGNTCGAQHVPGLLLHGDLSDVLGLAAPKPVLFEMGRKETCFHFPDMMRAYRRVERIYRAAGAMDRIGKDVHPNDHMWSGRKAWDWLGKWL